MVERALLDTGVLVAILSPSDSEHERCLEATMRVRAPLLNCWPVLAEGAFLLASKRKVGPTPADAAMMMIDLIAHGSVQIVDVEPVMFPRLKELARQNPRAQLADLCLAAIAERCSVWTILTLDRRDFGSFRFARGKHITILPE